MLTKLRALFSLLQKFGLGWMLFRAGYALRKRLGLLRAQFPAYEWDDRPLNYWLKPGVPSEPEEYLVWKNNHTPKFFFDQIPALPNNPSWNPQRAVDEAETILAGELRYFERTPYSIGFPPDWHLDPHANVRLDAARHWTRIPDYGAYDIKFIWEASRFNQVYTLVRAYAFKKDERYPESFWILVEDWARNNPPQRGPNWMCGQETSLRLLAWTFGLFAFRGADSTTPARRAHLAQLVACEAERIRGNVDYAISTRGNHAVSEGFGLWLAGTFFPELKQSDSYRKLGKKILEQEARKQIFRDGTYAMYSLNYHRFVLRVYFLALKLGELNHDRFSDALYQSVAKSLDFMAQLIEPLTGEMPMYGSNDGALVCPLDACDFADFRPTLQAGWYLVRGKRLFEAGAWDETLFWLNGEPALRSERDAGLRQAGGRYPEGGVHILRGESSAAFIRCTDFRERPSHADQLHVDLWMRGQNIAVDAGTFLYNGQGRWQNGLAQTRVHNTVTVDDADQMTRLSRFTWGDWARGRVLRHEERFWQGEHDGYARRGVRHMRSVLALDGDRWLVVDRLAGARPHRLALHWLLNDFPVSVAPEENTILLRSAARSLETSESAIYIRMGLLEGEARFSLVRGDEESTRGWRSRYYGEKEPALSAMLEAERADAVFWTFFGWEGDAVKVSGGNLEVTVAGHSTILSHTELFKRDTDER